MPLESDVTTGTGKKAETHLDQIQFSLSQPGYKESLTRALQAAALERSKSALPAADGFNFNPEATLDTSRVGEALPLYGPAQPQYQPQDEPASKEPDGFNPLLSKKGDSRRVLQHYTTEPATSTAEAAKPLPEADRVDVRRETTHAEMKVKPGPADKGPRSRDGSPLPKQGKLQQSSAPDPAQRAIGSTANLGADAKREAEVQRVERMVEGGQRYGTESSMLDLAREQGRGAESKSVGEVGDISEEMKDSSSRATRKGLNSQRGGKVEAMTTEEYNALSPKQKAAIDLNTMLVNAVAQDRKITTDGDNPGGKAYDAQINELFGPDAHNARYAPNTVDLLDKINYSSDETKLNDFLKLKTAFTTDDLDALAPPRPGEGPDASLATPAFSRDALQASLVKDLQAVRKDPADASALRETGRDLLGLNDMPGFGPARPTEEGGSLEEQVNFYFQNGLKALASEPDKQKVMADLRAGMPEEYWPKFIAFLDASSRESKQYHIPIQTSSDGETVSPKQFRHKLGLNR